MNSYSCYVHNMEFITLYILPVVFLLLFCFSLKILKAWLGSHRLIILLWNRGAIQFKAYTILKPKRKVVLASIYRLAREWCFYVSWRL